MEKVWIVIESGTFDPAQYVLGIFSSKKDAIRIKEEKNTDYSWRDVIKFQINVIYLGGTGEEFLNSSPDLGSNEVYVIRDISLEFSDKDCIIGVFNSLKNILQVEECVERFYRENQYDDCTPYIKAKVCKVTHPLIKSANKI